MESRISEFSKKTKETEAQVAEITASMEELLGKAITETKHVEKETRKETLHDRVLLRLLDLHKQGNPSVSACELAEGMNLKRETIMFQLNGLLRLNLIRSKTDGRIKYFSLTRKGLQKAEEIESRVYRFYI